MKAVFLTLVLVFTHAVGAQVFHFDDTITTLIKTTDQSPAHWYIEILNDVGVDTNLRWICTHEDVPSQWIIHYEDQTNHITGVQDGDSADFVLFAPDVFNQKLIIGADLNNTPAHAKVHFDIFNPLNRDSSQRITYQFIISQGTAQNGELSDIGLNWYNGVLRADDNAFFDVCLYDYTGKLVEERLAIKAFTFRSANQSPYFMVVRKGTVFIQTRIYH